MCKVVPFGPFVEGCGPSSFILWSPSRPAKSSKHWPQHQNEGHSSGHVGGLGGIGSGPWIFNSAALTCSNGDFLQHGSFCVGPPYMRDPAVYLGPY